KSNLGGDFIVLNGQLVDDLKAEGLWNKEMLDQLKYFNGELANIEGIPEHLKKKYQTVFEIGYEHIIDAAARRQKWIDQSQSVNLFLAKPDMKSLSHMYRRAWHTGMKTTYYLRSLGASEIEKSNPGSNTAAEAAPKKEYTAAEAQACSIDAMMNGGECEACQ
ncbi:ribonucleoside-diphosphate reductase subunit alpha, partial [bacterium]|nr:ribonucleoside-diphosphate reductase subunit alpha [bacterium]